MSYDNPRIMDLNMTPMDVMVKMADGNPGAVNVMCMLMKDAESIDPDAAGGGLFAIMHLDTLDIYGSRIWQFYKDVCGQNLNRMLGLMRAVQLGKLGESKLRHAIDNDGDGLDIPSLLAEVAKELPDFVMPKDDKAAA